MSGFDPVIHAPGRLQICAILSAADEAEFAMVREALAVSDSVLSKHLKQLEEVGYLRLRKQASAGRQRTWIALTPSGKAVFAAHVAELQRLAGLVALAPAAPEPAPAFRVRLRPTTPD